MQHAEPLSSDSTGVSFTISDGDVPEPATWARMMSGFALVGVAVRRRGRAFVIA